MRNRREIIAAAVSMLIIAVVLGAYLLIDRQTPAAPMVAPAVSDSGVNAPYDIQSPASGEGASADDQKKPSGNSPP